MERKRWALSSGATVNSKSAKTGLVSYYLYCGQLLETSRNQSVDVGRSEKRMYSIGLYDVITTAAKISVKSRLEPAAQVDMPSLGQWCFNWKELWKITDFEHQNIIKISSNGFTQGLLRYAVYSDENNKPYLLEILHLESLPKDKRLIDPIGRWLIWYASETGLKFCIGEEKDILISLDSVEAAISYYRDIIRMEPLGWTNIAPGEDGYAFCFTHAEAKKFICRQTNTYGDPKKINL